MPRFSYKKYCEWCEQEGAEKKPWAEMCDGLPVIREDGEHSGMICGTPLFSVPDWEEDDED